MKQRGGLQREHDFRVYAVHSKGRIRQFVLRPYILRRGKQFHHGSGWPGLSDSDARAPRGLDSNVGLDKYVLTFNMGSPDITMHGHSYPFGP